MYSILQNDFPEFKLNLFLKKSPVILLKGSKKYNIWMFNSIPKIIFITSRF